MGKDNVRRVSDLIVRSLSFKEAMNNIEVLKSFFETNYEIQNSRIESVKKKYYIGLKIDDIISGFATEKGKDIDFNELNEQVIDGNLKVKDVINLNVNKENDGISFSLNKGYTGDKYNPMTSRNEMKKMNNGMDILYNSTLSNIIIIFEEYLKSMLIKLIIESPEKYFENKQIPITKLFNASNSLLYDIISDEVEKSLYDSLECLDTIITKENFQLDAFGKIIEQFKEIYYRRNLLVHNNGIVNDIYISKSGMKGKVKTGTKVKTDYNYIIDSLNYLIKVICCLEFYMEKKVNSKIEDRYTYLDDYAFKALSNNKYEISKYIYGMIKTDKTLKFSYRLICEFNYLNSLKQLKTDISKELNSIDVSATEPIYKIAKYCLEDNNEEVYNLLTETYPNSCSAKNVRDWPLFIDFRKTKFYDKFVENHKQDFDEFDYENQEDDDSVDGACLNESVN